jgi:hypothetical protein
LSGEEVGERAEQMKGGEHSVGERDVACLDARANRAASKRTEATLLIVSEAEQLASRTGGEGQGQSRPNATCGRATTFFAKTGLEPRTTTFTSTEGVYSSH